MKLNACKQNQADEDIIIRAAGNSCEADVQESADSASPDLPVSFHPSTMNDAEAALPSAFSKGSPTPPLSLHSGCPCIYLGSQEMPSQKGPNAFPILRLAWQGFPPCFRFTLDQLPIPQGILLKLSELFCPGVQEGLALCAASISSDLAEWELLS